MKNILITLFITISSLNVFAQSDNKWVKIGEKYRDFSAKTIEGKTVKLSDSITGKISIIHLWSSYCGGSIAAARTIIPTYEKYKDKGLVVIGIANESKNADFFKKVLEKEKHIWLDLINLDNESEIWNLYGLEGAGGALLLVDKDGTILSHNVKKFEKIIRDKLK